MIKSFPEKLEKIISELSLYKLVSSTRKLHGMIDILSFTREQETLSHFLNLSLLVGYMIRVLG